LEWPESESSSKNANLTQCDKLKSDFEFLMFSAGFEALDTCYVIFEMCLQCSFDQQVLRTKAVMFWLFGGFLNEMLRWTKLLWLARQGFGFDSKNEEILLSKQGRVCYFVQFLQVLEEWPRVYGLWLFCGGRARVFLLQSLDRVSEMPSRVR
jgi:hypothetical protein